MCHILHIDQASFHWNTVRYKFMLLLVFDSLKDSLFNHLYVSLTTHMIKSHNLLVPCPVKDLPIFTALKREKKCQS